MAKALANGVGIFFCALALACGPPPPDRLTTSPAEQETARTPAASAADQGVTVDQIVEETDEYLGDRVIVSGEIAEVWAPRAFTIGGQQFLENDLLLVVARRDLPAIAAREVHPWLMPNDIVQVRGVVRRGPIEDIEREIGFDLGPGVETALTRERVVVVADRVLASPRRSAAR